MKFRTIRGLPTRVFALAMLVLGCPGDAGRAGEATPSPGARQEATSSPIDEALRTVGKRDRRERIDALLETWRKREGATADLAVMRLLNAKAKLLSGPHARAVVDEALARGNAAREPDDAIKRELAVAAMLGAEATRSASARFPLLERVIEAGKDSRDAELRRLYFSAKCRLAGLESDVAERAAAFRAVIDEIGAAPDAGQLRSVAAEVMNAQADIADPDDAAKIYKTIMSRFGGDEDAGVVEQVLIATRQAAQLANPDERSTLYLDAIERHGNVDDAAAQDELGRLFSAAVADAERHPDAETRLGALAAKVEGTRSADRTAAVLWALADREWDAETRADIDRRIIEGYRDSELTDVKYRVIDAALDLLENSPDTKAALNITRGLVEQYCREDDHALDNPVGRLLFACADAGGDPDGQSRYLDILLRRAMSNRAPYYDLSGVLRKKARLNGDPDFPVAFYDNWLALAGDDRDRCRILEMKYWAVREEYWAMRGGQHANPGRLFDAAGSLRERGLPPSRVLLAIGGGQGAATINDELLRLYGDTRDPEIGIRVIGAVRTKYTFGPDDEVLPVLERIERNFNNAGDAEGMKVLAHVLLEKFHFLRGTKDKLAVCDAVLALSPRFDTALLDSEKEEATKRKGLLLNDPRLLAEYYAMRAASSHRASERARFLIRQAENEMSRRKRLELYDTVVKTYMESGDGWIVQTVVKALAGEARLGKKRVESEQLLRDALKRLQASGGYFVDDAIQSIYGTLSRRHSEQTDRIRLYDEEIAFYKRIGPGKNADKLCDAMMKKFECLDSPLEKMTLLDGVIAVCGKRSEPWLMWRFEKAFRAKAEMTPDASEKVALYDTLLKRYENADAYALYRSVVPDVLADKVKALGDETVLTDRIESLLKLPAFGDDIVFAARLVEELERKSDQVAMYDRILAFYKGQGGESVKEALNSVEWARTSAAGGDMKELSARRYPSVDPLERSREHDEWAKEARKLEERYRRFVDLVDAEPVISRKIHLLDIFLSNPDSLDERTIDILLRKIELLASKEEKIRVLDDAIARAERPKSVDDTFTLNWSILEMAYEKKAALLGETSEKRALYDEAVQRYSDMLYQGAGDFVFDLRLKRSEFAGDAESTLAELRALHNEAKKSGGYLGRERTAELQSRITALSERE